MTAHRNCPNPAHLRPAFDALNVIEVNKAAFASPSGMFSIFRIYNIDFPRCKNFISPEAAVRLFKRSGSFLPENISRFCKNNFLTFQSLISNFKNMIHAFAIRVIFNSFFRTLDRRVYNGFPVRRTVRLGVFGHANASGPDGESLTGWNPRSQVRPLSVKHRRVLLLIDLTNQSMRECILL